MRPPGVSVAAVSEEWLPGDQVRHADGRGMLVRVDATTAEVACFSAGGIVVRRFDLDRLTAVEPARPRIDPSVFLADGAVVRGEVTLAPRVSVWYHAVVRGDEGPIVVGEGSNVQDHAVLHSDLGVGLEVGRRVSIGHGAVVRGARIGHEAMIGMNATVMTGAVIGAQSIVGAGSFVALGAEFPAGSMILGVPARLARRLSDEERAQPRLAGDIYLRLSDGHRSGKWGDRRG